MFFADFAFDTQAWPTEHVGALVRLMNYQWGNSNKPFNVDSMRIVTGLRDDQFAQFWAAINDKFEEVAPGKFINRRLSIEYGKSQARYDANQKRTAAASEARWRRDGQRNGVRDGERDDIRNGSSNGQRNDHLSTSTSTPKATNTDRTNDDKSSSGGASAPCRQIFDHWRLTMGKKSNTALDDKRRRLINARLKNGYTVEDCFHAIEGCAMTPFNQGVNDRDTKYLEMQHIFRDADQMDRHLRAYEDGPKPVRSKTEIENELAADQFENGDVFVSPDDPIEGESEIVQ